MELSVNLVVQSGLEFLGRLFIGSLLLQFGLTLQPRACRF